MEIKIIFNKNNIRRLSLLMLLLTFPFTVKVLAYGSSATLYTGQSTTFVAPTLSSNAAIYQTSWWSSNSDVSVSGSTYSASVRVNKYFSGTAYIYCDYYYYYYIGSMRQYNHGTEIYRVTCYSVDIRMNGSSTLELSPGESSQLSCRLSPNISPTPSITWTSSNYNVATVNNGYVHAIAPGTAVISAKSNAGDGTATCVVTVRHLNPQSISISPETASVYIEKTTTLKATVLPSGASQSVTWTSDNPDVATVNSYGIVTGMKTGTANIIATTEANSSISAKRLVTVTEPPFTISNIFPKPDSTGLSVFTKPSVSCSIALFAGTNYADISMKDTGTGNTIEGESSINGITYTFVPHEPLNAKTRYQLNIPSDAFKNKWGTSYSVPVTWAFRTGDLEKITLNTSIPGGFYSIGDSIKLISSIPAAKVYYTVDGSEPTESSLPYIQEIPISQDINLRARAFCKGYETSDILSADYYISKVNTLKKFPTEKDTLYIYRDVNPYITFGNAITAGNNINKVALSKDGISIPSEIIVADSSIFIIPDEPLTVGNTYSVSVPDSAVISWQGEANHTITWNFSTGSFASHIALGGNSLGAAIKSDGSLWNWGMQISKADATVGSYSYTILGKPTLICAEDVDTVSIGYMHHAIIKKDGSLWMWGRQYCGELGNNSNIAEYTPTKILDKVSYVSAGGQTTGIIKDDGSLWMCGRNDFGQIGDSTRITRMNLVKIMDDVKSVVAGWCTTYAIKNDGSLWAWGRNDYGQLGIDSVKSSLVPLKIMDGITSVATSAADCYNAAAIKADGSLWTWGRNNFGQLGTGNTTTSFLPHKMMDNITKVSVGADFMQAIDADGNLWAWGNNTYEQLGTQNEMASSSPVKTERNITSVAAGRQSVCILKENGSVWTWGRNDNGILGYDSTSASLSIAQIIDGLSSSDLSGLNLSRQNMEVAINGKNVIIAHPNHQNANYSSLTWQSSDNTVAQVSDRGVVKGISKGSADITATITGTNDVSYQKVCKVRVSEVTAVEDQDVSNLKIWDSDKTLFIDGIKKDSHIVVYNQLGNIVYRNITSDESIEIPLYENGIYIVKVENVIKKIINK